MNRPMLLNGGRKAFLSRLIANAAGQAGLLFGNAMLIRWAFDRFLSQGAAGGLEVLYLGTALLMAALAGGWLQWRERILAEELGQSYVHALRMRLFRQVTRMDPRRLQKKRRGAVMLKFVGDLNAVRRWVGLGLVRLIVSTALIASALAVLCLIDMLLALAVTAILGAGVLLNTRTGEALRAAAVETRRRRSRLSANISEKLGQVAVMQAFGRTDRDVRRVRRQSRSLRSALVHRAGKVGEIRGVTQISTAAAAAALLVVGILRVRDGHTTPGTVAAAMAVMGILLPALKNLSRVFEYHQEYQVASQKLDAFLAEPAYARIGRRRPDLAAGPGALRLEGVRVKGVLRGVTAAFPAGSVCALVGPNGSGKSTLVSVAARLIRPDRGRVLLDGQDIAKVSAASLRRAVGIASPDLPLMAGSLEKNLRYRCPECTHGELERVAALCGVGAFLEGARRGRHFRILEDGRNLSNGQRQRIQLARALAGSPRILLLDEADAFMDASTQALLEEVIRTFAGTVIWVTHRDPLALPADSVWRLTDGVLSPDPTVAAGLRRVAG